MNQITDPILKRINRYLKRTKMKRTEFGIRAAGVGALMARIESGKVKVATLEKVIEYLDREEA